MNIKPIFWRRWGSEVLGTINTAISTFPKDRRLDAELLLAHILNVSRSYLHAHGEQNLTESQQQYWIALSDQALKGTPIAYILGFQEFWSLKLKVTPDVLIPRPETELLVELALRYLTDDHAVIADLGTGSGAIAIALGSEKPYATIYATDSSEKALAIARENITSHRLQNVRCVEGFWLHALPPIKFDLIVSNPPYIACHDTHVAENVRCFEPQQALFSNDEGLADIKHIIENAKGYLKPGACLLIEHGFLQHKVVQKLFIDAGYEDVKTYHDLAKHPRVTGGMIKNDCFKQPFLV